MPVERGCHGADVAPPLLGGVDRADDTIVPLLLQPGRNCSQLTTANRFAVLVDGSSYYALVAQAIAQARRTVAVVGWDLDSRVRLGPSGGEEPLGPQLCDFLRSVASANPDLHIHILTWDFPLLFANVRDPKLVAGQDPFDHPRIHLRFDSCHAPGASHHQKIAVIDDCLAFAGGMDIAGGRWDTPDHRPDDVRRAGKDGPYPPSHDVQVMVDGETARALAGVVRDRWQRATGTAMAASGQPWDPWPQAVTPDFVEASVGLSLTDIDRDGCGDVEQLHLDLIAAARESIYIENQYLTSSTIAGALCRRLEAADGPDVVIVLPLTNTGWLEIHTIEALRAESIRQLRAADHANRLRICYPVVPGPGDGAVGVHSKVAVIDDRWCRVGSSNLTNRSMRLDTECDLTVEATSATERAGVRRLRNRLLAEHLGMSADAVESFLATEPSLVRLVDSRRGHPRCLRELPSDAAAVEPTLVRELVDPSGPLTVDGVIERLADAIADQPGRRWRPLIVVCVAATAGVLAFALLRQIRARSLRPRR
jgi:phospholipase D1/2